MVLAHEKANEIKIHGTSSGPTMTFDLIEKKSGAWPTPAVGTAGPTSAFAKAMFQVGYQVGAALREKPSL
jgi:hypothetical protein